MLYDYRDEATDFIGNTGSRRKAEFNGTLREGVAGQTLEGGL